jgi:hypothetical protein
MALLTVAFVTAVLVNSVVVCTCAGSCREDPSQLDGGAEGATIRSGPREGSSFLPTTTLGEGDGAGSSIAFGAVPAFCRWNNFYHTV